jgi:PAS domain S-box-containing protein
MMIVSCPRISPELLTPLLKDFPIGLLLCNMDGQFLYANPVLAEFLGYHVDELLNLSYWELTPEKYRENELLQLANLKHTGRYGPYEKEYLHRSGSLIPIRLNGMIVQIEDQSYIWSMIENTSSETDRHAHQDHHRSYAIHTEKMAALQQLVAGVAHEINNPINFIHGNLKHLDDYTADLMSIAQLCQTHRDELPLALQQQLDDIDLPYMAEDLPRLLQSTQNGSDRIRTVVQSLRRFSRLDHQGQKRVDIHEGLEDCLLLLRHRFQKSNIDLIRRYETLPAIECFPGDLNQAFLNILNNAIDAVEKLDHPTIQITTERYGKHLAIRIKDNGSGIEPSIAHQIFNPFFTTKPVGHGTGLGLTTSHQIITEQHQGFLSFQSVPDQGVEFMIQLPISVSH